MPTPYITGQGEVLDLICQRHYGRTSGVVEQVLEANRATDLAKHPVRLPMGLRIILPDIARDSTPAATIKLWD